MNLLSFVCVVTAVLYAELCFRRISGSRKDDLYNSFLMVCASLGWWTLCDAFFYVAPTVERAWLWHHLAALGWCGFVPATAWYFLVTTGADKFWKTPLRRALYWAPPAVLTVRFLCAAPTAFAQKLVQSTSGLGWTYVEDFHNPWPFLYLAMVAVYLGGALLHLYRWQRHENMPSTQAMATEFVALDVLAVAVGIVSVYLIPHYTRLLPPMAFLATLVFISGYWLSVRKHDLMHVEFALNTGSVFENSLDAMLITDENFLVLYANREAKHLLGTEEPIGLNFSERLLEKEREELALFAASKEERQSELELTLDEKTPLLASVTHSTIHRREHDIFILSLHDVSQLRQAQEKLNYLACFDELTDLPNRRRLGEMLDEWERIAQSKNGDFLLMFLDLNNFKSINDRFGHAAGDSALRSVARALQTEFPSVNETARLSGDEFIVLQDRDTCPPEELAQRIGKLIAEIDCSNFAPDITLDAAVGWCAYSEAGSVRNLFKMADERMYALKGQRHTRREER